MLIIIDEFGIRLLGPSPRRLVDFFGESAHGDRDLDASHIEEAARRKIMAGIPIELRGGDRGVRKPVERDIIENVVARQPFRLGVESARDHPVAANVMV